jgi:hypothetical protein
VPSAEVSLRDQNDEEAVDIDQVTQSSIVYSWASQFPLHGHEQKERPMQDGN